MAEMNARNKVHNHSYQHYTCYITTFTDPASECRQVDYKSHEKIISLIVKGIIFNLTINKFVHWNFLNDLTIMRIMRNMDQEQHIKCTGQAKNELCACTTSNTGMGPEACFFGSVKFRRMFESTVDMDCRQRRKIMPTLQKARD